jgi:hypothetical protein
MVASEGHYIPPPAPGYLAEAGVEVWRNVTRQFQLHAGELVILGELCKTADEIAEMEDALDEFGPLIVGSRGQRVINPMYAQIAAHRSLLDRLMLSLALPTDGESVGSRRTPQAKQAATARWKNQKRKGRLNSVEPMTRGGA